ncbi:hypothetical protein POTOM_019277 [Populus tomentosa]|uniref:Uncharacterized protein n=1 Tax=Populus tomentosa TaxID=118781 RepID=A0A8X7ZWU8_POPTO|nr:hypothetical protein POTOM_019277 [Populus tomentosa]
MKCPNYNPVSLRSSLSFSGHLAELERKIELNASTPASSSNVVVDNLRASMQIIDVASILGLDCDEISIAGNAPQKEIKILGEALQLSQPINNNSISVHMP